MSCSFPGQDFIPRWVSGAILEVKRISLCSSAWSFSHSRCTAEKAPGLGTHRAERRLPRNQLTVFTLLIHYWKLFFAAALQEQRYCSCHFQLHRQNWGDIFGSLFFSRCFFPLPQVPQHLTPLEQFLSRSICQHHECVESLLSSGCSEGPSWVWSTPRYKS